ncbi:MAG: HAD-IA family hydrolase [Actinomycetota bacterium]
MRGIDADGARRLEAVVFDMDGVLIDSEPIWFEAETEEFGALGFALTRAMFAETMGTRVVDVVRHWLARGLRTDAPAEDIAERLVDRVARIVRSRGVVAEGAHEALAFFARHGLRPAIASSSPSRLIDATLRACALDGRFEVVHSAEGEPEGKPDPAVYRTAAALLGVPPERCLAIEDSPAGVLAAKAAGMACVAIPAPGAEAAVRAGAPDAVLPSLRALGDDLWRIAGVAPAPGLVGIRDVVASDLPVLFEHQAEPEANRMAAFPARDREVFMAHWAGIMSNPTGDAQAIVVDGRVVGNVVAWDAEGERDVGYWIGREHWGRGIATAALSAFVRLVRTRPLFAHVATGNVGSIRVLEKCGFEVVRTERVVDEPGAPEIEELVMRLGSDGNRSA